MSVQLRRRAQIVTDVERWLHRDDMRLRYVDRMKLAAVLSKSFALRTVYSMRRELIAIRERSAASKQELVHRLQNWCRIAEVSGIPPLVEFSQRLRSFA